MGYLSQKKQAARKDIFFQIMAFLCILLTIIFITCPQSGLPFFNIFHLYCLLFILLGAALFSQKYKNAVVFALALVVCYTSLAMSCNIFLSEKFKGNLSFDLVFAPNHLLTDSFPKEQIVSSGSLILAQKYYAPFVVLDTGKPLTIIRVDLRGAKYKEYKLIFRHLREFILKQDTPVIIFGEFGVPAWEPVFKRFLNKTDLTVKNRLLFTEKSGYNIFTIPSFYVLGFQDMGVNKIDSEKDSSAERTIFLTISFNSGKTL